MPFDLLARQERPQGARSATGGDYTLHLVEGNENFTRSGVVIVKLWLRRVKHGGRYSSGRVLGWGGCGEWGAGYPPAVKVEAVEKEGKVR